MYIEYCVTVKFFKACQFKPQGHSVSSLQRTLHTLSPGFDGVSCSVRENDVCNNSKNVKSHVSFGFWKKIL